MRYDLSTFKDTVTNMRAVMQVYSAETADFERKILFVINERKRVIF